MSERLFICEDCAWPFPWGTPPDDAECDNCGGPLVLEDDDPD